MNRPAVFYYLPVKARFGCFGCNSPEGKNDKEANRKVFPAYRTQRLIFPIPPSRKHKKTQKHTNTKKKSSPPESYPAGLDKHLNLKKRQLPTLPLLRSTIGVTRLNFSVRNGKRWNPRAIATWMTIDMMRQKQNNKKIQLNGYIRQTHVKKVDGQLVMLGYDVTTCTPASYQRCSLQRPWEI